MRTRGCASHRRGAARARWRRCRVHFVRNALALVPKKGMQALVAATVRTVFAQPTAEQAREQWRRVADGFRAAWPRLATLLDEAEVDVLAYLAFPRERWRQIWSTNPLERLNKEVKRRTDVIGIFPNPAAAIRLVGALLGEQHDEWQVGRRYFSAESMALLAPGGRAIPGAGGRLRRRALGPRPQPTARTARRIYTLDGTLTPSPSNSYMQTLYIGQADNVRERLDNHNRAKEFWSHLAVFTSRYGHLNKAHAQYLESRMIDLALTARRAEVVNGNAPRLPYLSESDRFDSESFLDQMLLLCPLLGLDFFARNAQPVKAEPSVGEEAAAEQPAVLRLPPLRAGQRTGCGSQALVHPQRGGPLPVESRFLPAWNR